MKKIPLLCAGSVLALGAVLGLVGHARAADLPSHKSPLAAPAPAAPTWTGVYAGVEAGAVFDVPGATVLATGNGYAPSIIPGEVPVLAWTAQPYALPGVAVLNDSGFFGGAKLGYNYQIGKMIVIGVETDAAEMFGAHGTQTFASGLLPGQASFSQVGRTADFIGSAVGRAGFLPWNNLLLYVAGGLGYGHANLSVGTTTGPAWSAVYTPSTLGAWRTGWVAGGGVEWKFAQNWSVSLDYRHFDLGSATVQTGAISTAQLAAGVALPGFPIQSQTVLAHARFSGDVVKLGVNFHFNGLSGLTGNPVADFGLPTPTGNVNADGQAYQSWFKTQVSNSGVQLPFGL